MEYSTCNDNSAYSVRGIQTIRDRTIRDRTIRDKTIRDKYKYECLEIRMCEFSIVFNLFTNIVRKCCHCV